MSNKTRSVETRVAGSCENLKKTCQKHLGWCRFNKQLDYFAIYPQIDLGQEAHTLYSKVNLQ